MLGSIVHTLADNKEEKRNKFTHESFIQLP